MKKTILFSILITVLAVSLEAQNDTMYIMKNGVVVGKYDVNTDVDSLIYYLPMSGVFTDSRDANTYNWVKIGDQLWMAENLKYLPSVVGPETGSYSVPYYYVYGYNGTNITDAKATSNYNTYGVLYNWPAAMAGTPSSSTNPSGVQGVCPTGWHVPSDAEWSQLETFLGGASVAGGKLKETGTTHWISPNLGATNEYGFTALPGGCTNQFFHDGLYSYWWCATEANTSFASHWSMHYYDSYVDRFNIDKELGFSVRCVMN